MGVGQNFINVCMVTYLKQLIIIQANEKKMLKKMPRVVHNVLCQDVGVARSMQGTKYFNIALVLQLSCRTSALQFSLILQTYALVL